MPLFVTFECHCGYVGTVQMPEQMWQHRDVMLPKARCTVCGRLGARTLTVGPNPATLWDGKARPSG